jgi:hypothetical protein
MLRKRCLESGVKRQVSNKINEKLNSGKPRLVDGELHFRYNS